VRFFFDHNDNGNILRDQEGVDLPGLAAAKAAAAIGLAEYARDVIATSERRVMAIEVRGQDGAPVLSLALTFEATPLSQAEA
jgi:hypothetical protein